ncbi:MAG: hypothetical protein WBF90_03860 [Rivularia sp. (in: cyanobacteria)]|jgi:hypothetical protein
MIILHLMLVVILVQAKIIALRLCIYLEVWRVMQFLGLGSKGNWRFNLDMAVETASTQTKPAVAGLNY